MRKLLAIALCGSATGLLLTSAVTAQRGNQPPPGYDAMCLTPGELERILNTQRRQGWRLAALSSGRCEREVNERRTLVEGYVVVLER